MINNEINKKHINKKRRILSSFLCAILLLFISLTFAYMIKESHHECSGEDCTICELVGECQLIINHIGKSNIIIPTILLQLYSTVIVKYVSEIYFRTFSLVTHKIRMNN